jgi:simple sugar transport system ATP-binding protein
MVGEQVIDYIFPRSGQVGEKKLVLERVSAIDDRGILALKEVTFTVNAGEIVGVAGVQGSGQSELVEVISGLIHPAKGKIWLNGKDITRASPRQRREIGLAIIPEKRKEQGLNLNTNVVENVISTRYYKSPFSRWLTLFDRPAEKFAQRIVSEFSITMSSLKSKVENLSGGNQQKVIVGREMIEQPDVLIAAYPTRGLDVSAAQFVRETMIRRRDQGGAILLISADLDELFAVSDRILILYEGQIVGETKPDETSFEKVGLLMTGHFHAS